MNDSATIDKLVTENINLAHYFTKKYSFGDVDESEVFSKAMEGLLMAAKKYKKGHKSNKENNKKYKGKSVPFGSFASLIIRYKLKGLRKFWREKKRDIGMNLYSLNAFINSRYGQTFGDLIMDEKSISPSEQTNMEDNRKLALKFFYLLTPKQKEILSLYFGLNDNKCLSIVEIASKLKISKTRVSFHKQAALNRLRKCLLPYKNKIK